MSGYNEAITKQAQIESARALDRYKGILNDISSKEKTLESLKKSIDEYTLDYTRLDTVKTFFSLLEERARLELEQRVESLVNYGLQTVFGPEYQFKIKSEFKGNAVKTEFFVVDHGLELPFLDATGGGLGDVASFLLRVVMLSITKPSQRKLLILDEPFKFVSVEYFSNLGELLKELSESLDLQLIMVTHKPELMEYASTVIETSTSGKNTSKASIKHR